jgi:hypothetical protein
MSRGDRNRNGRLERLRVLVPVTNAIVGIDLADVKQMIVVTDHDSKVLAGKTFRCRAWDLGEALDWSAVQARAGGFCRATVACERLATGGGPGQLASVRGVPLVCVQPMLTSWARRSEDLAFDKTDEKDAVLIARLTAQLDDWRQTQRRLADTETRMTRVLDDLQLTEPATLMTGLSPVGAAAILAETGDPRRFATGGPGQARRPWRRGRNFPVRSPAAQTYRPGPARPAARCLAASGGAQRANPVYAARFAHLTSREQNRLTATQAQAVIAAAILRQLHAVITTGQRWDPVTATHGTRPKTVTPIAA